MNGNPAPVPHQARARAQMAENGERPASGVFRLREQTLGPDRRPDAAPVTYEMHCASCYAAGPVSADGEDGTAWAMALLKAHPDHLDYREHITRSYRAVAGAWR
jgi:hypothetical protein